MKKVLIIFAIIISILLIAAFTLPVIFKEDIKLAIDEEVSNSVNAEVLFDVEDFSLSMFTNFPNITASMKNFGVVNHAPFDGTVLFAAEEFQIEIDLFSLFGDTPRLSGISLIRPIINVLVLEDGTANYDIAIPSEEEEVETEEESGEFSLRIDHWELVDAELVYDDKTIPYYMKMTGFNHSGSGDLTQDVFDLNTHSSVDSLWVGYDGDMYMEEKSAELDMIITISDDYSKYTFKENKAKVNDFAMSFDGWFFMGEDFYDMDITYGGVENTFKSLLSIIPGMYTSDFEGLEAEGTLSFSGAMKGKYTDTIMPAFNLALLVENGMFKYPDLPTAVENIALDMKIDNQDGNIDNTSVNIANFHMDMGSNPFDAKIKIANLYNYETDANLKAKLNLGELNTMFPVEGLDMKGTFQMDMSASGTYDSTMKTMPKINGTMGLASGYFKSSEFPLPIEDLHFDSKLTNSSGKMSDFTASINDFTMVLDGEKFNADVLFSNLDNYTWDINADGSVDLDKMTHVFPLEGMELAGKIEAHLKTSGNYALVEQEKYDQLPTSGSMSIADFIYKDAELPYDVTISSAKGEFSPQTIQLSEYKGTVGRSDMSMKGQVQNYMGFIFNENEILTGNLSFNSKLLDMNELMPEEEEAVEAEEDTTTYQVIPIPKNIHFVMDSKIDKLLFMDLEVNNAQGNIVIKDGIANMKDVTFNMLGGSFLMAGAYDTEDPANPGYDFNMKIDNLGIKESYQAFTAVRVLAPMANLMSGKISTDFKISGLLEQDYMPKLESLSGGGLLKIAQAALGQSNLTSNLASVTKLDETKDITLKDVVMSLAIENGHLQVKPFTANFGDYTGTVSGLTGIDGSIDYTIEMPVPASKLGPQLTNVSSQLGLGEVDPNSTIPLNIVMEGTFLDPKIRLVSSEQKEQIKEAVAEKAKEEIKDAGTGLVQNLAEGTKADGVVNNLLGSKSDTTTTDSTKTEVKQQVEEKAKDALNNLLKRKKKN